MFETNERLRVFLTAPTLNPDATGEEFSAWQWANALSKITDLTVLAFQRENRAVLADTLPDARIHTVPLPTTFKRFGRFEAMAKPYYPYYMYAVRRFLAERAGQFDIAHQITPQAARYPIPLRGAGAPYVVGPLGGALGTPESFRSEGRGAAWFTRLRALDQIRFRYDPWLRKSYEEAELVLGVAPYMQDVLGAMTLKRFEPVIELGIADLPELPRRVSPKGELKLLHVGRGVRTKGLRDVIRALGHLKDELPGLSLDSAGVGEEIEICRQEADALGISDKVTFHGLIPREKVEDLYARSDVFVFPSYREPAGNVVYEAMRWGLPIIAAARGGPDWTVDDRTGIRIKVTEPRQYARDIADAIRILAADPDRRRNMGQAARDKLNREALWPVKATNLLALYHQVLDR